MAEESRVTDRGNTDMLQNLAGNWWAIALRGVAAVLFGFTALFWPPAAFVALVLVFGAYALVDGIFNLIAAIRSARAHERWGALVFEGIVSILAGLFTLIFPGIGALALVLTIGAWSLVTGVAEIVAAIRLRKEIQGEWLLALSGLLSIALGVLLFLAPGAGAFALTIWIGAYALVFGAVMIGLGFRLRSLVSHRSAPPPSLARQPA